MLHSCQQIQLSSIVFSSEWSLHPWECQEIPTALAKSFSEFGVLHPPIIRRNPDNGTYSIVHGYKRLFWARNDADYDISNCIILSDDVSPVTILDILLTDQLTGTGLSFAEKANFISIASRFLDEQTICSKFLLPLQLKKNTRISDLLQILDQDELILEEVHDGRLQEKMISEILKIRSKEERLTLVKLFKDLRLGDGKQRRLFTLIRDIALRGNLSIKDFLNKEEIQSILKHKAMNPPQKAQHLANHLQDKLTPEYNSFVDQFETEKRDLTLPSNCSLDHVQAFEKDEVTLSITFKNFAECKTHLPMILDSVKHTS